MATGFHIQYERILLAEAVPADVGVLKPWRIKHIMRHVHSDGSRCACIATHDRRNHVGNPGAQWVRVPWRSEPARHCLMNLLGVHTPGSQLSGIEIRSEERRVGKEERCQW